MDTSNVRSLAGSQESAGGSPRAGRSASEVSVPLSPGGRTPSSRSRRGSFSTEPKNENVVDDAKWRSHAREIMGVIDGLEAPEAALPECLGGWVTVAVCGGGRRRTMMCNASG